MQKDNIYAIPVLQSPPCLWWLPSPTSLCHFHGNKINNFKLDLLGQIELVLDLVIL